MATSFLSIDQLKRAMAIEEKIHALRLELAAIFAKAAASEPPPTHANALALPDRRKGERSATTRAKMAAAQRARWAKAKNGAVSGRSAPDKPKRKWKMSVEARKKIAAAQRRRWAALKAST